MVLLSVSNGPLVHAAPQSPPAGGGLPDGPWNNSYRITVELDARAHKLEGNAEVTFTNLGSVPVNELVFHLYANGFVGDRSVFFQELQRNRGKDLLQDKDAETLAAELGYCWIEEISIDQVVPSHRIAGSLLRVELGSPLIPGASVQVDLRFQTKLPSTIARMGYRGDHHDVMQWYPKLAAYVHNRWNEQPFHSDTEFFANFGNYDVTIITPASHQVGATGILQGEPQPVAASGDRGARLSRRFLAPAVHDFAWCSDPHFVEFADSVAFESGQRVGIRYLCQPYAQEKANLVLRMAKHCLERYAEWFQPYPYAQLTIDGLPYGLRGGMEYPMLFTISQQFPTHVSYLRETTEQPAGVTAHEFGHQYWYGILASNEFDEAWLDEGINTYVTTKIEEDFFDAREGRWLQAFEWREILSPVLKDGVGLRLFGHEIGMRELVGFPATRFTEGRFGGERTPTLLGFEVPTGRMPGFHLQRYLSRREAYARVAEAAPIRATSFEMHPEAYGPIVYSKTALCLATLERLYGWDAMRGALAEYTRRFWFRHPTGDDFVEVLKEMLPALSARPEAAAIPLEDILRQLLDGTGRLDYAVARVESERLPDPRGYVIPMRAGETIEFTGPSAEPGALFQHRVLVENRGSVEMPVSVELVYVDGTRDRRAWNGKGRHHWIELRSPVALRSAEVDPDGKLLLDLDYNNNGRTTTRNATALRRHKSVVLYWAENFLQALRLMTGP